MTSQLPVRHDGPAGLPGYRVLRAVAALPSAGTALRDCAALADTILAETVKTAIHPDGYWQRAPGDPRPDASLLLPPVRGALPGSDPRTLATLDVVRG